MGEPLVLILQDISHRIKAGLVRHLVQPPERCCSSRARIPPEMAASPPPLSVLGSILTTRKFLLVFNQNLPSCNCPHCAASNTLVPLVQGFPFCNRISPSFALPLHCPCSPQIFSRTLQRSPIQILGAYRARRGRGSSVA